MNILKKSDKQPSGPLTQRAPDYHPALQALSDDIAALDARIDAHRLRMAEIDKALNQGAQLTERDAAPPVLDAVRRLLHADTSDPAPARQTAGQALQALRDEFVRLQHEVELLKRGRVELAEAMNRERDLATARRRKEADVVEMQAELQAAARVLLDVHQRGQALAGELQACGFNTAAPQFFSGMELPTEAVTLLESVAQGLEAELPQFATPAPVPVPGYVRAQPQRSIFRPSSNW